MGTVELLKRAIPFFATVAFGLFIASFFVDVNPGFRHHEHGKWHHDMWELRLENEDLRQENQQLKEENRRLSELSSIDSPIDFDGEELAAPDVEAPVPPPPPPAVRVHRDHAR